LLELGKRIPDDYAIACFDSPENPLERVMHLTGSSGVGWMGGAMQASPAAPPPRL